MNNNYMDPAAGLDEVPRELQWRKRLVRESLRNDTLDSRLMDFRTF